MNNNRRNARPYNLLTFLPFILTLLVVAYWIWVLVFQGIFGYSLQIKKIPQEATPEDGHKIKEPSGHFLCPENDNIEPLVLPNFLKVLPKNGCSNATKALLAVLSTPNESEDREWVRETWGNSKKLKETTKLMFMVGQSQNSTLNNMVFQESQYFDDILILDFYEHYLNLTYKVYGMLLYARDHCGTVKCVQKTDMDAIVNVDGLEKLCGTLSDDEHVITGMIWKNLPVIRNIEHKYYMPHFMYDESYYPYFATGTAYLLSGYQIASKLLQTLEEKTPFFVSENYRKLMEDTMLTGFVREEAGIRIQDVGGYMCCMATHGFSMRFWCDESTGNIKTPIAFEKYADSKQEDLGMMENWIDQNESCI